MLKYEKDTFNNLKSFHKYIGNSHTFEYYFNFLLDENTLFSEGKNIDLFE